MALGGCVGPGLTPPKGVSDSAPQPPHVPVVGVGTAGSGASVAGSGSFGLAGAAAPPPAITGANAPGAATGEDAGVDDDAGVLMHR
jgi:hypothetical protein